MSRYTEQELFSFMDLERPVKVTCTDGSIFKGMCWAYTATRNEVEENISDASLEIGNRMIFLHEIEKIEIDNQ